MAAVKNEDRAPAVPAVAAKPVDDKDVLSQYYVGLTEACPLDFITVPTVAKEGAPVFQKFTQRIADPDGNGIMRLTAQQPGAFLKLFPDEVVAIKEYIKTHGIWWESRTKDEIRVHIVKLQGEGSFRRSRREDVSGNIDPLGKFMFITKAKAMSAEDREANNLPPTLLQEEEALASK